MQLMVRPSFACATKEETLCNLQPCPNWLTADDMPPQSQIPCKSQIDKMINNIPAIIIIIFVLRHHCHSHVILEEHSFIPCILYCLSLHCMCNLSHKYYVYLPKSTELHSSVPLACRIIVKTERHITGGTASQSVRNHKSHRLGFEGPRHNLGPIWMP